MVELERVTGACQSNLMSSYTCTCSQFDFMRTIVTKEQMLTPFSLVMYYVVILELIQYFFGWGGGGGGGGVFVQGNRQIAEHV